MTILPFNLIILPTDTAQTMKRNSKLFQTNLQIGECIEEIEFIWLRIWWQGKPNVQAKSKTHGFPPGILIKKNDDTITNSYAETLTKKYIQNFIDSLLPKKNEHVNVILKLNTEPKSWNAFIKYKIFWHDKKRERAVGGQLRKDASFEFEHDIIITRKEGSIWWEKFISCVIE